MTEQGIIEAIHLGIHTANVTYEKWSDGFFLSDAAVEGLMVTYMAQQIMALADPPPYLQLECSVEALKADSGRVHRGKPCARTSGLARLDMAILNSRRQLKFAVEAKCSYTWAEPYYDDMARLIKLQREFSKDHTETAMQAGILALFVHSYSEGDYEKAERNMETKLNNWEARLIEHGAKHKDVFIRCSRSHLPYHQWSNGDEVHLASSLCAIVKSK